MIADRPATDTPSLDPAALDPAADVAGLRLAIVNWRDPWHPAAGGAERYAWELARRLAARGAHVTYVTCRSPDDGQDDGQDDGRPPRRRVEGVEFARMGGRFGVYPRVLLWMLARRRRFDAVIDCQNGIPFFTPWALPRRVPVFCVIHHVHDQQFGLYFPAWLAWIGRVLEGPVTRWTYRRHACVVVSMTTRQAVKERLRWRGPAYVVPNGVDVLATVQAVQADSTEAIGETGAPVESATPPARPAGPKIVCVTRLVPHKRIERVVDLAALLRDRWPGLRVDIVGDGPAAGSLAERITRLGLEDVVVLHGFVSEERKAALVRDAVLHLSTSRGEGWGLSVVEAAAQGVPTIAYDVEGLRDAVRDGVTGWLVPEPAPPRAAPEHHRVEALAEVVQRACKELDDPERRAEVARACREWGAEFDWSRTTGRMAGLVAAAVRAGSSATTDDDAHVVHGYGDERPRVVEGPARDELLRAMELRDRAPHAGSAAARPRIATPLERLLGRALDEGGSDRSDPSRARPAARR